MLFSSTLQTLTTLHERLRSISIKNHLLQKGLKKKKKTQRDDKDRTGSRERKAHRPPSPARPFPAFPRQMLTGPETGSSAALRCQPHATGLENRLRTSDSRDSTTARSARRWATCGGPFGAWALRGPAVKKPVRPAAIFPGTTCNHRLGTPTHALESSRCPENIAYKLTKHFPTFQSA